MSLFLRSLVACAFLLLSTSLPAVTWTPSAPVNTDAAGDSRVDDVSDIQIVGNNAVAVWTASAFNGGFDIYTARSSNKGVTWTAPVLIHSSQAGGFGHNFQPTIETDNNGTWVCSWVSHQYPGPDLDIVISRSSDNGATWSAPSLLNSDFATDTLNDYAVQLRPDGNGVWVAVWTRVLNGTSLYWARSTDNAVTWSTPLPFSPLNNTHTGFGARPSVDTDGSGNWIVTVESDNYTSATTGGDWEIFSFRSSDNGLTWTGPSLVNTNFASDGLDAYSFVRSDKRGIWIVAWATFSRIDEIGGTDGDIAYASSTDNGLTWSPVAAINSDFASDTRWDALGEVETDGTGNWVAVWHTQSPGDNDVYSAQSTDNGNTWTGLAAMNSRAGTDSRNDSTARVSTNGEGDWLSIWNTLDSQGGTIGTEGDILFARSTLAPQLSDVSVIKTDSRDPVAVSTEFTYTISVHATGSVSASPVVVVDSLPSQVEYVSHTASQGDCNASNNSVTCELGSLAPSGGAVVKIVVRAITAGDALNIVTVGAPQVDPDSSNNSAEATTTIALSLPGTDLTGTLNSVAQTCRGTGNRQRCTLRAAFNATNLGQDGARSTSVLYYLSDDQVIDPTDVLLARKFTRFLKPNAVQRISMNVTVPKQTSYSGKYVIAVIDLENGAIENNEENNTDSALIP